MGKGYFVTGTDTDVGKTQVVAAVAAALHKRWSDAASRHAGLLPVRLWKPVQSGARHGSPDTDSCRLLHGSGLPLREADVATRTFEAPVAPWIAARRAGAAIDFTALVAEGRRRLAQPGTLLVEGAGGLLVPLTERELVADLAAALALPLVIVARAQLGTVNHTLLTVEHARRLGLTVLGVVLNGCRQDGAEELRENVEMIERFGKVPVIGRLPWLEAERTPKAEAEWAEWRARWSALAERHVRLDVFG